MLLLKTQVKDESKIWRNCLTFQLKLQQSKSLTASEQAVRLKCCERMCEWEPSMNGQNCKCSSHRIISYFLMNAGKNNWNSNLSKYKTRRNATISHSSKCSKLQVKKSIEIVCTSPSTCFVRAAKANFHLSIERSLSFVDSFRTFITYPNLFDRWLSIRLDINPKLLKMQKL